MFTDAKAFSSFAAPDVAAAGTFYADVLGLRTSEEDGLLWLHLTGGRDTLIYPKPDHEPAGYTILNFPVDDVERAVDDLAARGVTFLRYEAMEADQDERGIFRGGGPPIAWFADPAGNVLSVIEAP